MLVPFTKEELTEVDKRTYKKTKAGMRNTVTLQENILTIKKKMMKPCVILGTTIVFTIILLKQNIAARCVTMQYSKF